MVRALLSALMLVPLTAAATPAVLQLGPVSATSVAPLIKGLKAAAVAREKAVIVSIDSPGGSIGTGFDVLDAMKLAKGEGVTIICYVGDGAMAASMAAVIFEVGCSRRVMAPTAVLMFHNASTGVPRGNVEELLRQARELQDIDDMIAAYIAPHMVHPDTKKRWTAAEYQAWVHGHDRYVSADSAFEQGMCDAVLE